MNCKVNRLQAIMLFQCSSHTHHSTQRLSIMSQHTPTHHLHCSSLHSTLWATQLQTSVQHHTAHQTVLPYCIVAHLTLCYIMSCPHGLCCVNVLSCQIISCCVMLYHLMPCHVLYHHETLYFVMLFYAIYHFIPCNVISCCVMICHISLCYVM